MEHLKKFFGEETWMKKVLYLDGYAYGINKITAARTRTVLPEGVKDSPVAKGYQKYFTEKTTFLGFVDSKDVAEIIKHATRKLVHAKIRTRCTACNEEGKVQWRFFHKGTRYIQREACPVCGGTREIVTDGDIIGRELDESVPLMLSDGIYVNIKHFGLIAGLGQNVKILLTKKNFVICQVANYEVVIATIKPTTEITKYYEVDCKQQ